MQLSLALFVSMHLSAGIAQAAGSDQPTTIHEDINSIDFGYLAYLNYLVDLGYLEQLGYMEQLGYYIPDPIPSVGPQLPGSYPSYLNSLVGLGYVYGVDRPDTNYYFGANGTSHLSVDFYACEMNGDMDLRIGTDAGYGVEAYVDGELVTGRYEDIWWDFNWFDGDSIYFTISPTEGPHTLDIYAAEDCCAGGSALQYLHNWTDWTPFVAGSSTCLADADADEIPDAYDNCPNLANEDQADADDDGIGDACEADTDTDGVVDDDDHCADTPDGAVVNADGCTIDQLNPCGGTWKNHGAYVSSVTATAQAFRSAGLISQAVYSSTVTAAARSTCGK